MVAPVQPIPPSAGPPTQPDLLALLSAPGKEALRAQIVQAIGVPEPVLLGMPVEQRNALIIQAAEQIGMLPPSGSPVPPPPPALPPQPPQMGGMNGPVPVAPPVGGSAPVGGGVPVGMAPGAPPMAGNPPPEAPPPPVALPPPIDLAEKREEKGRNPALPPLSPPPDDWEPEALADLKALSNWREKPTVADLVTLADDALEDTIYRDRNQACFDQSRCYYRSMDYSKLNGQPVNFLGGDLIYKLSSPAKQLDRIVARASVDSEHLLFSLSPRAEQKPWKESTQNAENWSRDQWRRHLQRAWDRISQHGHDAALERKIPFLGSLHGSLAFQLRPDVRRRKGSKRDLNADYPVLLDVFPLHEAYQFGDCTIRVQALTLKEGRRLNQEIRTRWPAKTKDEQRQYPWWPGDDTPCRLITFSDCYGFWYAQCFDLKLSDETSRHLTEKDEAAFWLTKPEAINYGFCALQVPPGWQSTGDNVLPDERQPSDNYGRNFARGALFANLDDFAVQDQAASAALSAFRYNRNPASVDKIDAVARKREGEKLPDKPILGEGGRNTRWKEEGIEFIPKHFADTSGDNFLLSLTFGQTADTFPAALGGGGDAQSGYDRRQMVENAQLLHVEQIRNWAAGVVAQITRLSLLLLYRYGTGSKKMFTDLPFKRAQGGVGEATLTIKDLQRAGIDLQVRYHEEDLEREARLNMVYLPRFKEGAISAETLREYLNVADPAREEERIDEEFALQHPAMKEAKAMLALHSTRNPLYPFLAIALDRDAANGQKLNSAPQMASQAGQPSGNMPTAEAGLAPGQGIPQGMSIPGVGG